MEPTLNVYNWWTYIYVVCTVNRAKVKRSTGLKCGQEYWENGKLSPKFPEYSRYMEVIGRLISLFYRAINELRSEGMLSGPNLSKRVDELIRAQEEKAAENVGVMELKYNMLPDFQEFMRNQQPFVRYNTWRKYRSTYNLLFSFGQESNLKLDILTFDRKTYEQFLSYLIFKKDLLNNSVAKHVGVLKTFFKRMYPDYDYKYMKFSEYTPDVIALNEDELNDIRLTPFPAGYKKKTRDLFLFLASTGMRYSDSQRYQPGWVEDGLIGYNAIKTNSKAHVPLFNSAKAILEEYGGYPPKISNQKFNDYIKLVLKDCGINRPVILRDRQGRNVIEKICPLYEVATSHLGRKTFTSILLEKGIPIQDVMSMTGHQDYRSMRPYIALNKKHLREYSKKLEI